MRPLSCCLPVILSMEVRHKHLDNEAPVVQATDTQALTSEPVTVQDLVGKTIQGELVEGRVQYWSPGEDAGPGTDDAVIKEVTVGQNFPALRL